MTLEAITNEVVKFVSTDTHLVRDHGPCQLRRIRPGARHTALAPHAAPTALYLHVNRVLVS
jgi:hypothetical protein